VAAAALGGGNTQAADWDRYDPWSADDLFYSAGKKTVPANIADFITEASLAY